MTAVFSNLEYGLLSAIVLLAAITRGYAGFGFSAIVVVAGSFFLPTKEIVPLVIVLEIVASIQMANQVWKEIAWKMVGVLFLCSLVMIPLGQFLLLKIPVELTRILVSAALITAVTLYLINFKLPIRNNVKGWTVIGSISGFMSGLFSFGGLWIVVLLLNTDIKIAHLRASLITVFFFTGFYATLSGYAQGLFTETSTIRTIWLLPALIIGVIIGSKRFAGTSDKTYKKIVITILGVLGLALAVKTTLSF